MGWRNQIPLLLDLGYRVVCPDMMGYGGTVRIRSIFVIKQSIQMTRMHLKYPRIQSLSTRSREQRMTW